MILNQKYRRSNSGTTVHREDCKVVNDTNSLPWDYAECATADEIKLIVQRMPWLRACSKCKPHVEPKAKAKA